MKRSEALDRIYNILAKANANAWHPEETSEKLLDYLEYDASVDDGEDGRQWEQE